MQSGSSKSTLYYLVLRPSEYHGIDRKYVILSESRLPTIWNLIFTVDYALGKYFIHAGVGRELQGPLLGIFSSLYLLLREV